MSTCFVIQPFDAGKFEKRFNDVFKPALEQAGFEPYRVDRDPNVDVPVESIEKGIRNATICLADISTNNPNVWYELGFAFAMGRPLIMVCSNEREEGRFPFDIQHRSIIEYTSESVSDFESLKSKICERAKALQERAETKRFIESEQVAPQEGVTAIEIQTLALAAAQVDTPSDLISIFYLKKEAISSGITGVGFAVALRRLQRRKFVRLAEASSSEDEYHQTVVIEDTGWNWIDEHESLFVFQKDKHDGSGDPDIDDDIPF